MPVGFRHAKGLRRIHLQAGCTDRMNRAIDGLIEVLIDEQKLVDQMEQATKNRGRTSRDGALVVVFHPCSKAEADYVRENNLDDEDRITRLLSTRSWRDPLIRCASREDIDALLKRGNPDKLPVARTEAPPAIGQAEKSDDKGASHAQNMD